MASDRAQYNRALRKWDGLHEAGAYSVPNDQGCVAILWSDYEMSTDTISAGDERDAFMAEAYEIASDLAASNIESQIFPAYTLNDARDVLTHRDYTSIITISNGNLSTSYAHRGDQFDWRFVSQYSSHLKTGRFIQRHCGQAIRQLSVPLGTFGMNSHFDVYAAYDTSLPTTMRPDDEYHIKQLHGVHRLGYRALKNLFIGQEVDKPSDDG